MGEMACRNRGIRSHGRRTSAPPRTVIAAEATTPKTVPSAHNGWRARTKPPTTGTAVTTPLRAGVSTWARGIRTSATPTAMAPLKASELVTAANPCRLTRPTIASPMKG